MKGSPAGGQTRRRPSICRQTGRGHGGDRFLQVRAAAGRPREPRHREGDRRALGRVGHLRRDLHRPRPAHPARRHRLGRAEGDALLRPLAGRRHRRQQRRLRALVPPCHRGRRLHRLRRHVPGGRLGPRPPPRHGALGPMAHPAPAPRNRLASEPSPYLQQHAHNPVDWWPWGEAAFAEARRRDVPVFLSIGYATCHWCHVMAHESFEDEQAARLLNEAFVCVKVDREERPDVDDAYMAVCQAMTGSGGWPLTVFTAPDKRPFLATTYVPKTSRFGRLGLLELVPKITAAWADRRDDLMAQAGHVLEHVAAGSAAPGELPANVLEKAEAGLARRFDRELGGFGGAPKFPSPHTLLFLLRRHARTKDAAALDMVVRTLDAMAAGGIHDHLGGGFHRYSTDAAWLLPHFEKMLYDQAMLAMAYTEAFQATGEARFAAVARSTLDYVLRDLADPAGGVRCAEDADSEGVGGKFYVWTKDEIEEILGAEAPAFCAAYGVAAEGNVHDEATHRTTGANVLHLSRPLVDDRFASARAKLLAARNERVRPLLDDKVLVDWNGLAIAALAKAGTALGEPRFVQAAVTAARFVQKEMRRPDGRLRHRWKAGAKDGTGFLDDHAFLLWGLLELYDATLDPAWLEWAIEVAEGLRHFRDEAGGWFLSPTDGEDLGVRRA